MVIVVSVSVFNGAARISMERCRCPTAFLAEWMSAKMCGRNGAKAKKRKERDRRAPAKSKDHES